MLECDLAQFLPVVQVVGVSASKGTEQIKRA